MAFKRHKMSRRKSRRNFSKHSFHKKKNSWAPMRGGWRV